MILGMELTLLVNGELLSITIFTIKDELNLPYRSALSLYRNIFLFSD